LTLLNKDVVKTPLEKPITVYYWLEPVDPQLKDDKYITDLIEPEFVVRYVPLEVKKTDETQTIDWWVWLVFAGAVVLISGLAIFYFVLHQRKKKLQLCQAIAEGKVTMKDIEEMNTEENVPDKEVGDANSSLRLSHSP